jgi:hypothetical protein
LKSASSFASTMDRPDDPAFLAALEDSRREHQKSRREIQQYMQNVNASVQRPSHELVDLTLDSDDDSDIQVVHPKSKSVISSETDVDDYDDDELQRAINMSMESSSHSTISAEEQRLRRLRTLGLPTLPEEAQGAINLSTEDQQHPRILRIDEPSPTVSQTTSSGLPGLDRKQMEQERLARNAKRKAQDSVPTSPARPILKAPRTDSTPTASPKTAGLGKTPQQPANRLLANPTHPGSVPVSVPAPAPASNAGKPSKGKPRSDVCLKYASNAPGINVWPTSRPVAQWPLGAVKKTHLAGFPRTGNEITIEEVIQRDDLEVVILSSFLWDMEWLFRKLNTTHTRIVLTMQANDQETVRSMKLAFA